MMKKRIRAEYFDPNRERLLLKKKYDLLFFRAFMANFKLEGLTPETRFYFLRELWRNGTCATFLAEGAKYFEAQDRAEMLFADGYDVSEFDNYLFPRRVRLLNPNNAAFYPKGDLLVHKDIALCWINDSHLPVYREIAQDIRRIVNVEMVINTNLQLHKMPFVFTGTEEDKRKFDDMLRDVVNDELAVFLSTYEVKMIENLQTNTPYIIDKLNAYLQILIGNVLTALGVDNSSLEKNERLLVDEVNANNNLINLNFDAYERNLKAHFEEVEQITGAHVEVKRTIETASESFHDEENGKEKDEEEEEDEE